MTLAEVIRALPKFSHLEDRTRGPKHESAKYGIEVAFGAADQLLYEHLPPLRMHVRYREHRASATRYPELNELQQLGQHFKLAIQLLSVEAFTTWIEQASRSAFEAIHRFASGLTPRRGGDRAAVSSSWSNGQVEGQVHSLKPIKRTIDRGQMYGLASFQLLRRRVLPYNSTPCVIERNWYIEPLTERSRDNLPDPEYDSKVSKYAPVNGPAIGDLFDLFDFTHNCR